MSQPAFSKQVPRDVIRLACPSQAPDVAPAHLRRLCQEMIQRLAEAGNGRIVRPVPADEIEPLRDSEVAVIVDLQSAGDGSHILRLMWRSGPGDSFSEGPAIAANAAAFQSGPDGIVSLSHRAINETPALSRLLAT